MTPTNLARVGENANRIMPMAVGEGTGEQEQQPQQPQQEQPQQGEAQRATSIGTADDVEVAANADDVRKSPGGTRFVRKVASDKDTAEVTADSSGVRKSPTGGRRVPKLSMADKVNSFEATAETGETRVSPGGRHVHKMGSERSTGGHGVAELQKVLASGIVAALDATLNKPAEGFYMRCCHNWRWLRVSLNMLGLFLGSLVVFLLLMLFAAFSLGLFIFMIIIPGLGLGYAFAELFFWFAWKRKYDKFNAIPDPCCPRDPDFNPAVAFEEFVLNQKRLCRYICIKEMMRTWFWDAPLDEIKRGNVADLVLYGFFYKNREQMEKAGQGHVADTLVTLMEHAWGIKFEEGHNKNLKFMAHLWEPLNCQYRPLAFYITIELIFWIKHLVMISIGFMPYKYDKFTYYVYGNWAPQKKLKVPVLGKQGSEVKAAMKQASLPKQPPKPADPSKVPILFMHGIGMGLFPYIPFIGRLALTGQPIMAFESNHLGMRWVKEVPDVDTVVHAVVGALKSHGVSRVCLSGHSYGTFHCSRFLQMYPEMVQSLCLMDPVNFNMFTGKLIRNFVYRPNKQGNFTTFVVARDVHHATSVQRNFYWSLINLWPEQLPRHTLVVLSGRDKLVPVPETITMLHYDAPQTVVLFRPRHKHAEFINDAELQKQVAIELHSTLKKAEFDHHRETAQATHPAAQPTLQEYSFGQEEVGKPEEFAVSPPLHGGAATPLRLDDKRVFVETKNKEVVDRPARTAPGHRSYGGTMVRTVGSKGVVALESMGLHFMNDTSAKSFTGYAHKRRQQHPDVRIHPSSSADLARLASAHNAGSGRLSPTPEKDESGIEIISSPKPHTAGAGPSTSGLQGTSTSQQGNGAHSHAHGLGSSGRRESEGSSIEVVAEGGPCDTRRAGSGPSVSEADGTDTTASIGPTEHGTQNRASFDSSSRIEVVTHGSSHTGREEG